MKKILILFFLFLFIPIVKAEEIEKGTLKWDEMITASEKSSSMGGSQIFLKAGEKMSVTDMLKGIAIASGNDVVVTKKQSQVIREETII